MRSLIGSRISMHQLTNCSLHTSYDCKGAGYAVSQPAELAMLQRVAVHTGIILGT